ncbi:relaxase/mobilization nuclease domain-containing protein [uncultured Roseobacter sp.]|uniref:relaxase/mobilization nuclease domain-containing protein n=1 Tax=uncultured Roseobacter sp. TaxID=114847 RepID=UPI00261454D6|nr:relaxase/mobilization nuclease domain-containing protein [uncultured Roseobacter sp.]
MILKAKERGDAPQLARYLLSMRDNDHVALHEVSGFASDDLLEAFHEADAIARGTRCKNHLFSMSLNPPDGAKVSIEDFEKAAERIAKKLGLEQQPRAIVFHEKDGRRHAHVVWSRIDIERMRAINMPHYKTKLRDVSRELFLEHDWEMPRGLQDKRFRNPLSFTREEWQQSKRVGVDPREIKSALQQCWQASDNRASFEQALKERGFWLAKGDRRGVVALDYRGEVYSLSRYGGVKSKELEGRLGNRDALSLVAEVRTQIANAITPKLEAFIQDAERDAARRLEMVEKRRAEMVTQHRTERETLKARQDARWDAESKERAARLPRGLSGIWHRLTGDFKKIKALNERETLLAWQRDREERDALAWAQLDERHALQQDIKQQRDHASQDLMDLRKDVANYQIFEQERDQHKRDRDEQMRKRRSRRHRRNLDL